MNSLKRNDRTTITELKDGDRFRVLNDKTIALWTKTTNERHPQEKTWAIKDGDKFPTPIKRETTLVFLRSAQGDAQ